MDKTLKTTTLIIGAGPAGLAYAMELSKAGKDFIVVEKDSAVGGLAKTYTFNEDGLVFLTDNGPHRFFSKNKYLYDFIENLLDEKWITVKRQTRQYIDGKFYDYPVNFAQALRNVGILKSLRMGFDYFVAKIQYGLLKKEIKSFEDYIVANFGRSLGEFNMINYTEKIWGIPAKDIHPDWAKQRIKGLNVTSLVVSTIKKMFKTKSDGPKTLVDTFYYPESGTGLIYETIKSRIEKLGYKIFLNTEPVSIKVEGNRVKEVLLKSPEGQMTIQCENLVESIPITRFLKLIDPSLGPEILEAGGKLRHRSQVYLFVTLNKDSITDDQWIYFPDKDVPIARISEMKNFSKLLSPSGKTSIFIEFFCFEGDNIWNMDKDELFALTLKHMSPTFFTKEEVRNYYMIKKKDVYPVYDLEYQNFLKVIKGSLDKFSNLYYIGRPGRFRYNNQDHSLEMGMLAAKSIIDGVKYDMDEVGAEDEYFEKGSVPANSERKNA